MTVAIAAMMMTIGDSTIETRSFGEGSYSGKSTLSCFGYALQTGRQTCKLMLS